MSDDFLSGASGEVSGIKATSKAVAADALLDVIAALRLEHRRLTRAAARAPRRRVLVLAIERAEEPNLLGKARDELARSRHEVQFASTVAGERGKFENLNLLLAQQPAQDHDWLLVVDDDVALPSRFLDVFVFLAERFRLRLAQPAHCWRSHAAWAVTRRRPASVVRETTFVETGPVFAFHRTTFAVLLPFPALRAGWGLDAHWSAIARQHNWKLGIVDATPVGHGVRRIAASYDRAAAIEEARQFLAGRPYVTAAEANATLATHRSWR